MSRIRTPSSLKWLLDKRARLLGELIKHENSLPGRIDDARKKLLAAEHNFERARQELATIESAGPRIIERLRLDIQALDNALGHHEIQINPELIPPIRTPDTERYSDHGKMTRAIFECLKMAGGHSASTLEIADHIAIELGLSITDDTYQTFRKKVNWRLKNLCRDGKIRRLHQVKGAIIGRWALPDDPALLQLALTPSKLGRPRRKRD
jgi:hypothetical protein